MALSLAFHGVFLFIFLVLVTEIQGQSMVFNVMKYGAVADGKTDNSKAFGDAWNEACKWKGSSNILVPIGTFMVGQVAFVGPCNGPIFFQLRGVIKAPLYSSSLKTDRWISFRHVDGLMVAGGGVFDGQGSSAWPYNNCDRTSNCIPLPASVRLDFINNSMISDITSIDSKYFHINLYGCNTIKFNNIRITAPAESPNTDGIHIGSSSDIQISDANIGTGDDCISMIGGSKNIKISNVQCGPGHGISIGSLGKHANEEQVSDISVRNCRFNGTDNGVRIKTWASSLCNTVTNLTFEGITVDNVDNPIIIDQQYCPLHNCNPQGASEVQIQQVKFRNITGTSSSKLAVNLLCSRIKPCQQIELNNINIDYYGKDGPATSSCSFVKGISYGEQKPPSCL